MTTETNGSQWFSVVPRESQCIMGSQNRKGGIEIILLPESLCLQAVCRQWSQWSY